MGVIILAGDDSEFRQGDYIVMHSQLTSPPTAPKTTYILHTSKFTEKDIIEWSPIVSYRLVVILKKAPKLTDKSRDLVIEHRSLPRGGEDFRRPIEAFLRWDDRNRAHNEITKLPIPLTLSIWRMNRPDDIETARRIAKSSFQLSDDFIHAIFAFSVKSSPERAIKGKLDKDNDEQPHGFRRSDCYTEELIRLAPDVANHLRSVDPSGLPKGVKKRKESLTQWL